MFSVLPTGNLCPCPLCIVLLIINFPTSCAPVPFNPGGKINTEQIAPVGMGTVPFDMKWLIPLYLVIISLLILDICRLFMVLVARIMARQSSQILTTTPPIPRGGFQHRELVLLEGRPDIEPTVAPPEPDDAVDSIRRHNQDNRVETIHEDSILSTLRRPGFISNLPTTPFDNDPHTIARPTIGTMLTLSVAPITQEFNNLHELMVYGAAAHASISSPTPSSSTSLFNDDLSRISRNPSYSLGEGRHLHSPAGSTRPPTYRTRTSEVTISTLPLYQENEDGRSSRASSRRSASTTRAHRERPVSRPPLPPSPFPTQKS